MALFELFYSLIFMNPFIYPQTFSAISLTSFNFAHCSSSVSLLPISQEAKPHCGLKQSLSREIYLAASYILLITSFLSSSLGDLVVIKPKTTFLSADTFASGSNEPERSSSYSRRSASTFSLAKT